MDDSTRTEDLDGELVALLREALDDPDSRESPPELLGRVQQNSLAVLRMIKSIDTELGAKVDLVDGFTADFGDLVTIVSAARSA